jgi:hypothetical protein
MHYIYRTLPKLVPYPNPKVNFGYICKNIICKLQSFSGQPKNTITFKTLQERKELIEQVLQ